MNKNKHRLSAGALGRAFEVPQTKKARKAAVDAGLCPDCRRPLAGEQLDGYHRRGTCPRCGFTVTVYAGGGLYRALGGVL